MPYPGLLEMITDDCRAVGVKTVPTKPLTPGQDQAKVYRARKQIVSTPLRRTSCTSKPECSESLAAAQHPRQKPPLCERHKILQSTLHIKAVTDTYAFIGREWRNAEFSLDLAALWHRYVLRLQLPGFNPRLTCIQATPRNFVKLVSNHSWTFLELGSTSRIIICKRMLGCHYHPSTFFNMRYTDSWRY